MVKRFFLLGMLVLAGFLAWRFGYPAALKHFFRLSGTVNMSERLLPALPGPNSMLFVVAVNEDNVPVAVTKIINPIFPAAFEMNASNLIMPDLLTGKIYLEARLNTHGELAVIRRGDLKGSFRERVNIRQKGLEITLTDQAK